MLKKADPLANQFQLLYLQVKVLQHLSQQASVPVNQHQAQQMLAKVLQQVQATQLQLVQAKVHQPAHRLARVVQPQQV